MGCAVEIQILEISADADFPLPAYGCRVYFGKELRDLAEALPHVSPALVAKMEDREGLAAIDATILIARCGARASHIANRRQSQMRNGIIFDPNRPPCH